MPLLKKKPFKRQSPPEGLQPNDEVFFCEATKEVFKDYESFFQRTILCNSLVWSCSVTGKSNLTYDEAVESEQKARKRLGDILKPLKKALLWVADHTNRGRIADLADDVYVFSNVRYFVNEIVEGIINEQWCDCKVLKVLPPSQEEIDQDAEEEREEEEKNGKSPSKKPKAKKSFFPPDHLFKYELQEIEPDNPDDNPSFIIDAEDIRREKGIYTREKNTLFLKNLVELQPDGNLKLVENVRRKYQLEDMKFVDIFDGPEPHFPLLLTSKIGSGPSKISTNFISSSWYLRRTFSTNFKFPSGCNSTRFFKNKVFFSLV
jgi:bromodomain adjacent to zinc finger domain protein 1A